MSRSNVESVSLIVDPESGKPLIRKVRLGEEGQQALAREFETLKLLDGLGITPSLLRFNQSEASAVLDLAFWPGKTLKDDCAIHSGDDVSRKLEIAISLCECVVSMHNQSVCHLDISNSNVLVSRDDPSGVRVCIVDFAQSLIWKPNLIPETREKLNGTLSYISPELCSRQSGQLDHRSDIYSLGILFYELFVGSLPFQGDAGEVIYAHKTRSLPVPSSWERCPRTLFEILKHATVKDVSLRYQTAKALLDDLRKQLDLVNDDGEILHFHPGQTDQDPFLPLSIRFLWHGETVQQVVQRLSLCSSGQAVSVHVRGSRGVGKSSLLLEVQKRLSEVSLECFHVRLRDEFTGDPLGSVKSFFLELAECFDERSEREGAKDAQAVRKAFDAEPSIICAYFPQLLSIFGDVPPIQEVNFLALEGALQSGVQELLRAVASVMPFCVVIEEWSGLSEIARSYFSPLVNKKIPSVGVCVSDTCVMSQPKGAQESPESAEKSVTWGWDLEVDLKNWNEEELSEYLSVYRLDEHHQKAFVRIVHQKTAGHPGAVRDVIRGCFLDETLRFQHKLLSWILDLKALERRPISHNIVDQLIRDLSSLTSHEKTILAIVSTSLRRTSLEELIELSGFDEVKAQASCQSLVQRGFLEKRDEEKEAFLQRQSYQLSDPKLTTFICKSEDWTDSVTASRLGRVRRLQCGRSESQLLELSTQLLFLEDVCLSPLKLEFPIQREEVLSIYRSTAERLEKSGSFQSARTWFQRICRIASGGSLWEAVPLDDELNLRIALSDYQAKDFDSVLERLRDFPTDSVALYTEATALKMDIAMIRDRAERMLSMGMEALETIHLKEGLLQKDSLGLEEFDAVCQKVDERVCQYDGTHSEHADLPYYEMKILSKLVPPTFQTDKEKYKEVVLRLTSLVLRGEMNAFVPYALVNAGVVLIHWNRNFALGARLGEQALELLKSFNVPWLEPTIRFVYSFGISPCVKPLSETMPFFSDSARAGHRLGDHVRAFFAEMMSLTYEYSAGVRLEPFRRKLEERVPSIGQSPLTAFSAICSELVRHVDWMVSGSVPNQIGNFELMDSDCCTQVLSETGVRYFACFAKVLRCERHLLMGSVTQALEDIREAYRDASSAQGMCIGFRLRFYYALIARLEPQMVSANERDLADAFENEVGDYVVDLPDFYQHYHDVFMGVRALQEAPPLFSPMQLAAMTAHRNGFLNDSVLSVLTLARRLVARGESGFAQWTLMECEVRCKEWGARQLANSCEELRREIHSPLSLLITEKLDGRPADRHQWGRTSRIRYEELDLSRLIKATQAISSVLSLNDLLKRVLDIMFESASADSGSILSYDGTQLRLLCQRRGDRNTVLNEGEGITLSESSSYAEAGIHESIVREVLQSRTPYVFSESDEGISLSRARQFKALGVRTSLYLPIARNDPGGAIDIAVLSHSSLDGLFDASATSFLSVLSGQASVSLNNARLIAIAREKLIMENELKTANAVQEALFPESLSLESLDVARAYRPADQVGGDWHGVFTTGDGRGCFFFCGDVTGHGVASALVTGVAAGAVEAFLARLLRADPDSCYRNPEAVLKDCFQGLNDAIWATGKRVGRIMTMVGVALVQRATGEWSLHACNSGHCHPIIIGRNGKSRILRSRANPLGLGEELQPTLCSDTLHPNEHLLIYSDGLLENSWPKSGRRLNARVLLKALDTVDRSSAEIVHQIEESLGLYDQDFRPEDDSTLLVVCPRVQMARAS